MTYIEEFTKFAEETFKRFENDFTIKSINIGHKADGSPFMKVERLEDCCSPVAKLNAVVSALKVCEEIEWGNGIKFSLGTELVKLTKELNKDLIVGELLELFLDSHFTYKECGKTIYCEKDKHAINGMIELVYGLLEDTYGRDELIKMLNDRKNVE